MKSRNHQGCGFPKNQIRYYTLLEPSSQNRPGDRQRDYVLAILNQPNQTAPTMKNANEATDTANPLIENVMPARRHSAAELIQALPQADLSQLQGNIWPASLSRNSDSGRAHERGEAQYQG
jgi:hypothetical protein